MPFSQFIEEIFSSSSCENCSSSCWRGEARCEWIPSSAIYEINNNSIFEDVCTWRKCQQSSTSILNRFWMLSLQSNILIKMSFFWWQKMIFHLLLSDFTVHDIWRIFQILNSRRFHALANWIIIIFINVWHFSIHRAKYEIIALSRHVCARCVLSGVNWNDFLID